MDERETLGKYLRQKRESKKISLREVAKSTKVREHILEAIEKDQHHLLPPATYVKGFLLSYAKYLSLDPEDILLRYKLDLGEESVTPLSTHTQKRETKVPFRRSPTPPLKRTPLPLLEPKQDTPFLHPSKLKQKISWNTKQILVIGGIIAASLVVFSLFSPYPAKPPIKPVLLKLAPEEPGAEKLPVEPSFPATAPPSVPEEKLVAQEKEPLPPSLPATMTTAAPEKKPFSLQIKANEETWVSLRVDDQSEKEMTFKPGEGISIHASNQLRIIIGNAGGLDLILDEKPLERFGKSGEVITLFFTSRGVEVKRGLSRE